MNDRLVLIGLLLWCGPAQGAEETLQNDSFTTGDAVNFQAGFVAGEIAAARFVPGITCPCVVKSLTLLFGGDSVVRAMGVMVWEDTAGAPAPGPVLFSGDASLTGSNLALQVIDLSLSTIIVNGPFRVGVEFNHDGLPGVATDTDGTLDAGANFIRADVGVPLWFNAATLGVTGDFVLRATIDNLAATDSDADGVPDSSDNCVAVANAAQRDTDDDSIGNACDADIAPAVNDCIVNFPDLAKISEAFFTMAGDGNFNPDADFDGDGRVNFSDVVILRGQFFGAPGPSGLANDCN